MMTPKQIVEKLDEYIIGQNSAKRTIAVALRNRYRRMALEDEMKNEVMPKNILMIGSTGVGKTEIARRLSKMFGLPFASAIGGQASCPVLISPILVCAGIVFPLFS